MLPNQKRLTTTLFKDTIDGGMTYHSSLFILKLLKTIGPSRFSVSVPKKVAKSAVERNKIRRRVYSAIRILYPNIKESHSYAGSHERIRAGNKSFEADDERRPSGSSS